MGVILAWMKGHHGLVMAYREAKYDVSFLEWTAAVMSSSNSAAWSSVGQEVIVGDATCGREDEWEVAADFPFLPFFTGRLRASWHSDLADV